VTYPLYTQSKPFWTLYLNVLCSFCSWEAYDFEHKFVEIICTIQLAHSLMHVYIYDYIYISSLYQGTLKLYAIIQLGILMHMARRDN